MKIHTILWKDAAYSYEKKLPSKLPLPDLTTGSIVSQNEQFINIAMNGKFNSETGEFEETDGLLIPKSVILELREIGSI